MWEKRYLEIILTKSYDFCSWETYFKYFLKVKFFAQKSHCHLFDFKFKIKSDFKVHIKAKQEVFWTCFVLMWTLKSDLTLNLKTHEWQCEVCEKNFTFKKYLMCHTKFPMSRNQMTLLRLSPCKVFLTKFTLNPV